MKDNKELHLSIDNRGNVNEVRAPIIRVRGEPGDDHTAIAARVLRRINWREHNPTPERPRQGRKRGMMKNRASKRGTGKGGKK